MPQDAPPDGGARDSVRRAARGNGPVATPEPRPGPTQQAESWHASSVPSASEGLPHSIAAHRGAIAADEDTVLARPARPMLHEDGQDMGRNDNGALTCVRLRISVESNWRFQQLNPITAHCHRRRREVNIRGTQRQGSPRRSPHHAASNTAARYLAVMASTSATTSAGEAAGRSLARSDPAPRRAWILDDRSVADYRIQHRPQEPIGLHDRRSTAAPPHRCRVPLTNRRRGYCPERHGLQRS